MCRDLYVVNVLLGMVPIADKDRPKFVLVLGAYTQAWREWKSNQGLAYRARSLVAKVRARENAAVD